MNMPAISPAASAAEALGARIAQGEKLEAFELLALVGLASGAMPDGLANIVTQEMSARAADLAAVRLDTQDGYRRAAHDAVDLLKRVLAASDQRMDSSAHLYTVSHGLKIAAEMMPTTSPLRAAVLSLCARDTGRFGYQPVADVKQVLAAAEATVARLDGK